MKTPSFDRKREKTMLDKPCGPCYNNQALEEVPYIAE